MMKAANLRDFAKKLMRFLKLNVEVLFQVGFHSSRSCSDSGIHFSGYLNHVLRLSGFHHFQLSNKIKYEEIK